MPVLDKRGVRDPDWGVGHGQRELAVGLGPSQQRKAHLAFHLEQSVELRLRNLLVTPGIVVGNDLTGISMLPAITRFLKLQLLESLYLRLHGFLQRSSLFELWGFDAGAGRHLELHCRLAGGRGGLREGGGINRQQILSRVSRIHF